MLCLFAVAVSGAIPSFRAVQYRVEGTSMQHTLEDGDRVAVVSIGYRPTRDNIGDVVIIRHPGSSIDLVKRVVAVGPAQVSWDGCQVLVDGVVLSERGVDPALSAIDGCGGHGRVAVRAGDVFVLGDHRGASSDSRSFGPVPVSNVLGKVVGVVWPLGRIGSV